MKLSIIIPAFNVAQYIEKCIESIMCQNMKEYDMEVIIINDGSEDNTLDKIEILIKKYSQLIFINQENQGVSVARNRGLEIAKGEYILFIDPDDYIYPNSILPIIRKADSENLDILYLKMDLCDEQYNFLFTCEKCGEEGVIKSGLDHPRRTFPATLYRRSTIGQIKYIKGVMRGQDSVFNAMVQSLAKRVSYYHGNYYIYLQRNTSSRQFLVSSKTYEGCFIAIKYLNDFRKSHFNERNRKANLFFDEIMTVFVQRIIEWNILPVFDKEKFYETQKFLKIEKLSHLIKIVNLQYPYFDSSFSKFAMHQKKLIFKTKVYQFIQKLKP